MELFIDPGDISAPKGSPSWCRGVFGKALAQKSNGQFEISMLQRSLRENDNYKMLVDVDRQHFASWEDFVQYREPFGLDLRAEVAAAILAERDTTRLLQDVIDSVPVLAKHGGDRATQHEQAYGVSLHTRHGNSSSYLASRIKRDAPEIAARISEFPSMAAAAKAAGIPAAPPRISLSAPDAVAEKILQQGGDFAREVADLIYRSLNTIN